MNFQALHNLGIEEIMYKRKHQHLSFTQASNHKKDTKVSGGKRIESENTRP
jgi:hypothetical protein